MFWPSPRDLTISPKVAPITRVTRYPETNGVVTMIMSGGGANGSAPGGGGGGGMGAVMNLSQPRM